MMAKNTLLQPKFCVTNPPMKGPSDSPTYTAATLMPRTWPRSLIGNTDVRIATPVPKIMALPTPCSTLEPIRSGAVGAIPEKSEARVKTMSPYAKTRFLP